MTDKFQMGMTVAIVRIADGKTLATAEIDKINEKEIRTETPYEQLADLRHEPYRRYWRNNEAPTEMRIPKGEKDTRVPCTIRQATAEDKLAVALRVEVRRAKERLPRNLYYKEQYERDVKNAEERLAQVRQPWYERLLVQISKDEILIASEDEGE